MGQKAKKGDTVKVNYTGKLEDGSVFDSSEGRDPLEFTIGSGQVIKGFDIGAEGLEVGESRTVTIEPKDAYGEHNKEAVLTFDRSKLPEGMEVKEGQKLMLPHASGQMLPVTVTSINDKEIVLDANHELAGKTLIFDISLVSII